MRKSMPAPSEQIRTSMRIQTPRETVLASWVHVSDLHFGHGDAGHQWNQQRVLDELRIDAKALVRDGTVPWPDLVFVTGDIAFSGGARTPAVGDTEYALASRWFRQLQEELEIPDERVFMVPGNHDVDRRADADVRRLLKLTRAGEETLDDTLQAPLDRDRLRGRMARYLAFAQSFGPPDATRFHDGLWWRHSIDLAEGISLRVCGLNTALLSLDDEDQGRLRIGQRQLSELLVPAPGDLEIALLLGHHPTTGRWLADEKELRGQLDRHAALYLFGHLHEADSEQSRHGWGTGCLRIAAGAAHAEAAAPGTPPVGHGYNFGALVVLATGDLVVRIWPRRWSTRSPRFVPDVDNTLDRRPYAEHRLPERYRLHRPAPTWGLHAGEILGDRYRLIAKCGQGGVGAVWQAIDLEHERTVALKILNPEGTAPDPSRRAAFFRGALAMARLRHPSIVHIHDPRPDPNNQQGPYDFYVMDFVDAPNLGAAFKGAPCSDAETIEILLAIGEAVAMAHGQRVIHRDLKPSNILRDPVSKKVSIIDFDTAKDLATVTMTRSGDGLASTLYASPEILLSLNPPRGSMAPTVDARADIFSLAVIGIFLRTGRDPSHYYINRMPDLVAEFECAPGLREVLAKACAHAASDRYASVDDFLAALRRLQGATTAEPPASSLSPVAEARPSSLDEMAVSPPDGGHIAPAEPHAEPRHARSAEIPVSAPRILLPGRSTDAHSEPPWPFRTKQEPSEEIIGSSADTPRDDMMVDAVEAQLKQGFRLPWWWKLMPVPIAAMIFWSVVIVDRTPQPPAVALAIESILVEPGLEEERVREIAQDHFGEIRECQARLSDRLAGPVRIPLHVVVMPTGAVGSAALKYGINERPDLTDCVVKRARQWLFPKPSVPQFVGATIHIVLSPADPTQPAVAL